MNALHLPVVIHQLDREPIQQSLVAWLRRAQPEIECVVDKRRTEMTQPNVIHRDASGQRILSVHQPFCESPSAARALVRQLLAHWLVRCARKRKRDMRG